MFKRVYPGLNALVRLPSPTVLLYKRGGKRHSCTVITHHLSKPRPSLNSLDKKNCETTPILMTTPSIIIVWQLGVLEKFFMSVIRGQVHASSVHTN